MKMHGLQIFNSWDEMERANLKEASKKTYAERFALLMKLIKVSSMISNAKIIKSPSGR